MSQLQDLMNQLVNGKCTLRDFKKAAMHLARQGADLSQTDIKNVKGTLLHHLIRTNINDCNNGEITELTTLSFNPDFINIPDGFGCTPLQSLLNQLVNGKCLPEDFKKSALLLVNLGANPFIQDTAKNIKGTLLHHLIRTNKNNVNKKEIIQLLSLRKKLIDAPDGFGCTALQALTNQLLNKKCSLYDFKNSAMLLAKMHADITVKDTMKNNKGTLVHHLIRTNRNGENSREILELSKIRQDIINVPDEYGCTPLQVLMNQLVNGKCSLEDFKHSAMLLANLGANPEVTDTSKNSKSTLLHHLIRTNNNGANNKEIIALLSMNNNLINLQDGFGCTPLQAVMNQLNNGECSLEYFKQSAMLLAKMGADLTVKDTSPEIKGTLLHHLVRSNNHGDNDSDINELLVLQKDLINIRDGFGCTVLQTLMNQLIYKQRSLDDFKKHAMMFARLGAILSVQDTTRASKGSILHHLIRTNRQSCNNKEILDLLSSNKELVNIEDGFGNTPLQALMNQLHDESCTLKDFKQTSMLLAKMGADLHVKDSGTCKGTLLHLLILTNRSGMNNTEIADLLALKNDLITSVDGYHRTPLHHLLLIKPDTDINTIEKLLGSGSRVDSKDIYGETLLHTCCASGNIEAAKYFEKIGLDMEAKSNSGKTLLQCAAKHEKVALWDWLAGNDLNINQCDNCYQTALHLAVIHANEPMVKWLLKNKANADLVDINGNTAFMLAEKCGHKKIASLLLNTEPTLDNFIPLSLLNPGDPVREHQLEQVRAHIVILLHKEQELKDNHVDTPASKAAKLLCLRLEQYADAYVTSQITLDKFKSMSKWAINKAHEELDKPRGYCVKQILANLAFAIGTLVIGYLIVSAYKGTFFPLVPNTDATNKVDDSEATIQNIPAA